MKNTLKEIIQFTSGFMKRTKISTTDNVTKVTGISDDKTVVLSGTYHTELTDLPGTIGFPNLDSLNTILNCPEYQENANIKVVNNSKNQAESISFNNESGDYNNSYRLMSPDTANQLIPDLEFVGAKFEVEFEPSASSTTRFKYQSSANSDVDNCQFVTEKGKLVVTFGDPSSHTGRYIFHEPASDKLRTAWSYPVQRISSILSLSGDKTVRLSNDGMMEIEVDSGQAAYIYRIPALSK
jgi:hypothetical protein